MSYYATGSGTIDFKEILTEEAKEKVKKILKETFGEAAEVGTYSPCFFEKRTEKYSAASLWTDSKYYDYEVSEALDEISKIAEIAEGEIDYRGEDDTYWRFIWQDGEWREENGEVTYVSDTDIPTDKIRDAERILQYNGVESDKTAIVLKAIGYLLLNKNLYPKEANTAA